MPLDPKLLAALTAKSSSYDPSKVNWGDANEAKGAWNLGQGIIDILSTGGYASAGVAKKIGENVSSITKGDMGGLADLLNPLSIPSAAAKGVSERQTYAPLLENVGVDKNVAPWLGLALDIGLDPLTYVSGGTIAGLKGIPAGIRVADAATKLGGTVLKKGVRDLPAEQLDALSSVEKVIEPAAAPLTASQKMGNYLAGITRGYEFNKSAYGVQQLDRKLAKAAAKEAKKSGDTVLAETVLKPVIKNVEDVADPNAMRVGLLTKRNELLGLIEGNKSLSNKFAKLADKAEAASAVAFSAPKAGKVAEPVATAAAKAAEVTPETPKVDLEAIDRQERFASARLKGLLKKEQELNNIVRQLEDPRKQGGVENYATGLRPLVSYSANPKDPSNLVAAIREVNGKFRPAVGSKLDPAAAPNFVGKKVYETEAEAQAAATAHVEKLVKKSGVTEDAGKIAELSAQVDERIAELADYAQAAELGMKGVDPAKLTLEKLVDAIDAEMALGAKLEYIEVDLPAKGFDELAKAINFINSSFGKKVTADDLDQWAEKVNQYLSEKDIPGFPVKAGDVVPSDFWAYGDLLYVNRDGSIVVNKEVKIAEKVKAEEDSQKAISKLIESESKKAKKEPDFYARLGKDEKKFRDAEATFLAISKGELTGDANKALAAMQKIAPTYSFEIKTLPNGKTLVTKTLQLEPANVAPIFKQGALGIPSPASILQGAKAKTITLGQLARATKAPGKVGEEAKAFFTKAKQQLVEAKRKPVRTWEEMFADKAGVDFLINRVIPESADPEIFAKAKEFLKATLNQTDEIPNPDQLSEIFQEFLSGRNPLAAIRDGKIDVGLYIEPTSTKFKNVSELIDALTGPDQIELSVDSMNKLASALKINPDPTATRAELVLKSTMALFEARKDAEAAVGALRAMFESKGVNASVENALATVGVTDQAAVAAVAKEGVDVVEELGTQIDNAIESMTDGSPAADYVPNALVEKAMGLREQYALEFLNVTEDIAKLGISSPLALVMPLALRGFGSEALRKISLRAEKAGISTEEYITKLVSGEVDDIKRDPSLLMDPTAVRLDTLNTEARMDFFGDAWKAAKRNFGKGQRAGQDFRIAEESLSLKAIESVFRSMGIPVRVQENYGMRLLRAGLKQGDKLPESFAPLVSNVTYADIASLAHNTGATEIFRRLRFPKSGQNVMPSQFEYAFLTLKQVSEKGSPVPGTPEWDKVRKAFDTKYDAKAHAMIPADHVSGGMKAGERVAPSKDVKAGVDDAIAFMVEKLDILKGIDAQRAGIELAHTNAEVLDSGSRLYGALLRFSMMRSKFTGGLADLGKFNAYEGGINNIPGTAELFTEFSKFADALSVGKFRDAELATKMADAITNMLMFTKSGKNAGLSEQISKELRVIVPTLKNQMRERLMMGEATKGKPKVSETQIQKAKGNRRKAAAEANAEVENMTVGAIQNVEERVLTEAKAAEDAAAKGAKLPEDKSTVSTNLIAGNIDPTVAKLEMAADTMMKHGAMTLLGDNFLTKFSGTYGMGKEVKTIVAGIEEMNISSVQMFGSALKKLAVKYDRDIPAINAAFRFIQKWGKENYDAAELEAAAVDFTEWLSRQNTAGVNLDIVADLKHFVDSLFGDAGTMSGVIHRPVFARELDQAFGAQGLRDIKDGTGFIVPVDSGPELLKWSWAKSEVADDAKFNSLQVMHRYAAAMHAASTKLGIADSFTHFFGRTAAQIKEEGLNMADFFKVDPNAASGRSLASVLDENVYYSKAELDKLRYLEQYIMYDKTFQDSTKRIVDFSDRIVHVLKASHTTWRLGHHVTTVVGEYIMNILDGVVSTAYYENGRRILTKFDPSQYTNDPNVFKAYEMSNVQQGMQLKAEKFDSVGFLNRKGQRVLLSDDAVHALADRFGVLVKPGSSVEDFISSDPTFGKNFFGPISSVNEKIVKFSSSRDNFFRMAHFIKELEKGGLYDTAEEAALYAARRVHEYHPTVGSLSAFEKKYMRRIVFFYTWQRLAATKVFSLMLEQPGVVVIPSKIQYAFAEYNGFNPESFGDPWDPNGMYASYNTGSTYGPQFAGPQGAADAWGFQPAVPQLDILNSLFQGFTVQPGQSAADVITSGSQQLFGRNLSPLPKWFVELTSGEQVGGGKITSLNEYAINQVGGLNTLSKLTGIGQDPETQKTQAELDESRQRVGLNWLLGQKLNDYTTGAALNRYQQDQADIRKREAEAAFGSKPPTATY